MLVAAVALALGLVQTPSWQEIGAPSGVSGGIQIGLNPLITWSAGIVLWFGFVLQTVCLPRRGKYSCWEQTVRDMAFCCCRQRGASLFLCETALFWFDFVSDLAILLGAWFPNVVLFILMWCFLGCQLAPYMVLVFIVHPPKGYTCLPPPNILLDLRNLCAAPVVVPAAACTNNVASLCLQRFQSVLEKCWDCRNACGLLAALVWCVCGCVFGFIALTLFVFCWLFVLVPALVMSILWILAWLVLISIWIVLRLLLFFFGFILYVGMCMPFPEAPATQFFFWAWCVEDLKVNELVSAEVEAEGLLAFSHEKEEPGTIRRLSFQGVNIFTLHWTYIADLFESVAQVTIQILVACFGVCTWSLVVSIVFSCLVVLLYAHRYIYWLVIRPYFDQKPWQEELVLLHLYYYHTSDKPTASGALMNADTRSSTDYGGAA